MKKDTTVYIKTAPTHGFWSDSSNRLQEILRFFYDNKKLPELVDSSCLFTMYKEDQERDYTFEFFYHYDDKDDILYSSNMQGRPFGGQYHAISNWTCGDTKIFGENQYSDYKLFDFVHLNPFIDKYFSPSDSVNNIVVDLEKKYNIDYENLTACYYRGTDKAPETNSPPFDQYMEKVREVKSKHPETRFLFTTDELEYIDIFTKEFPDTIIINELIQNNDRSFQHGLLMFANVIIMSKAKYIICTSGNVSMWMMFYRGGAEGVCQYSSLRESLCYDHIDHINANYDPNQTKFWFNNIEGG